MWDPRRFSRGQSALMRRRDRDAKEGGWWRPDLAPGSPFGHFARWALVFALYFVAGRLGLAVPFTSSNVSPVWPAAGIGVAAVLIWGIEVAPAIALAAFLVNFLTPIPTLAAVIIGVGNALSAVVAGYLVRRFTDFRLSLSRLGDLLRFLLLAAAVATTVSASVGVTALAITHAKAWSGYGTAWQIWWLGDAMGVLVVAPLLIAGEDLLEVCRGRRALEFGLLCVAVLVTSSAIFGPWMLVRDDVLALVVFPFVVWAAIRFRVAGTALASLLLTAVAVWGTANEFGPFVNHTPLRNALLLQIFIAVTSVTGLLLASVTSERIRIGEAFETKEKLFREVEAANEELEQRVKTRTTELEQKAAQLARQAELLDLANDGIFVRNTKGRITYWNEGAERLYGWTREEAVGRTTNELLRTEFPTDISEILGHERWEGELNQTRRDGSPITVSSRWTTLRGNRGEPLGWLEVCTDITARKRAEEAARSLSGRILTFQDDERRRLARALHDSLGQYLAALKMNLDLLLKSDNDNTVVAQCVEMVEKCLSETRTVSHLLHPPLLDEAGFGSAARWYVEGFAQRSGIEAKLDLPPHLGRLNQEIEITLFRALQEALTNAHRHSGASTVEVNLRVNASNIQLMVKDNGRGIAPHRLQRLAEGAPEAGVGLAGMRERVRDLGGSLRIRSEGTGTELVVTIPSARLTGASRTDPDDSSHKVSAA
jgi:PAS domain S-box-containing protein